MFAEPCLSWAPLLNFMAGLCSVRFSEGRLLLGDLICGIKLTHDGAVAVIDGNKLLFSVEAEKLENRPRYSVLNRSADLARVLADNGLREADLAAIAIDGWARNRDGTSRAAVVGTDGEATPVDVAGYQDAAGATGELLEGHTGSSEFFDGNRRDFRSFTHATDHGLAGYCTSPFAAAQQSSLILVWDGGMPPCLYLYRPADRHFQSFGPITQVYGGLYPIFASHFDPFRFIPPKDQDLDAFEIAVLPISGKAMAYTGLGEPVEDAITVMEEATSAVVPIDGAIRSHMWSSRVLKKLVPRGFSDATLLASFQEHLCRLLMDGLKAFLGQHPELRDLPMCFSGGCALNIKWNARLRASGLLADVWVPPFPNDAGSAIGAGCAEMIRRSGQAQLEWSVFCGPELVPTAGPPPGWKASPCEIEDVARILAVDGDPVIVVDGRAELGPRALGHRSIIAPATQLDMRDRLNGLKEREWYRPVAPICLQSRAPEVFSPGSRDPYMLFDHQVRADWRDRIPAIVHADGSARLQTVGPDNPLMCRLLTAYEERTGIPVLCNTSANFKGSGFFPDAASAMRWGRVRYVWSENTLFEAAPREGG
jgi:carbamoyltransferase